MATLAEVLKDPNYVNANAATKAAIFNKYAPLDPNFANANEATQTAIKSKYGVEMPTLETPKAPAPAPAAVSDSMSEIPQRTLAQKIVYPILETALPVGGALVGGTGGTVFGPGGTIAGGAAGAGLGYGAAKELERMYEEKIGQRAPQSLPQNLLEAGKNVLEGATFEVGGRVILPPIAKAAGWVWDKATGKLVQIKANKIVQELAGDQLEAIKAASKAAPEGVTGAQAISEVYAPPLQTLSKRMIARAPYKYGPLLEGQDATMIKELEDLAGAATATEAKLGQKAAKETLNKVTGPMREAELEAAGTIDTKSMIKDLGEKLKDPTVGVSDINRRVINKVINKIDAWTKANKGEIDPKALYEIRKNTINEEVSRLIDKTDPTAQAKYAAKLLAEIRPVIDDAIETAGGTGWSNYLETFAAGANKIAQSKLNAKALELYRTSPDKFVQLIEGNLPKEVEKIFGSGNFNIGTQMDEASLNVLKKAANKINQAKSMAKQVGTLETFSEDILDANTSKLRFPNFLSAKTTIANETLRMLEKKVNKKVMNALEDAMLSGKSLNQLLNVVPAKDRLAVFTTLQRDPNVQRGITFNFNALAGQDYEGNQNALAQ
jgi:hypothetical protein